MLTHVIVMKIMNRADITSANHLKPTLSFAPPKACTASIVKIVMSAEPTPAQDLASVVSPSRSLPESVNAGIMDQYGMSIIVYVTPQRIYVTVA